MKKNPTEGVGAAVAGSSSDKSNKKIRKWVWLYIAAIAELTHMLWVVLLIISPLYDDSTHSLLAQILFKNRLIDDVLNDCTMCVDGTDFVMPYIGPAFFLYKLNDQALWYKVDVGIISGFICWISGP